MVHRRPNQSIDQPSPVEDLFCSGQRAVNGGSSGRVSMTGKWIESIDAIVSGQNVAALGKACLIPYREDIRLYVTTFFYLPARALQEIHEIDAVDTGDVFFRKD
jgi:hypothetical protein